MAATQLTLKSLAVRYQQLSTEIELLEAQLELLVAQAAPDLVAIKGIGIDCWPGLQPCHRSCNSQRHRWPRWKGMVRLPNHPPSLHSGERRSPAGAERSGAGRAAALPPRGDGGP